MTAEDVVVLTWYGTDEPLVELANLVSARIADALRQAPIARVRELIAAGDAIDLVVIPGGAVVFPVVMGRANSGRLQQQLEIAGLPVVGSGSRACRAAHDKRVLGPLLAQAGIPVAPYLVCERGDDLLVTAARAVKSFPSGCTVRPSVRDAMPPRYGGAHPAEVQASLEKMLATTAAVVLEANRSGGRTFSLSCLRDGARVASLPVVEVIESVNAAEAIKFYSPWDTSYVCPADIDEQQRVALDDIAVAAHNALGCVVSRMEVHVGSDGELTVCAFDAAPLLLPTSLFARAAASAGIGFVELVTRLVADARQHHALAD